ncbi:helix-turn-helix transcriptional regulator [Ornithinibacillus contaminans]|uniref:helix-turn-helix transcriptional regulator n=1 Tax=Ornithinibacillus contaminans TaxID=694055 RepID=UPI00069EA92E|nr:response regulator transcription factor [Ornithinibacillus contaminans]
MSEITIIKEKDLVRNIIIEKLEEKLPEHTWRAFDSVEFNKLDQSTVQSELIIIDLNAKINITDTIERFLQRNIRVAVWATDLDNHLLRELFRFGLHGYFYNGMELSELVFATKSMLNDQQYIHPKLSTILLDDYVKLTRKQAVRPMGVLTDQEWKVLEELGKGRNNDSIAKQLFISTRTVNNHVSSILKKLHVSDRTNAVIVAVKNNWITL